jgi:hypothetical protein
MEIPHPDLSKVTRMVFVHIRPMVMLSTSKTTSTRMLAVLAYSSMTSRDVSATAYQFVSFLSYSSFSKPIVENFIHNG